jgi:hypothetical protein
VRAEVCVESGVGAHVDDATVAWVHDVRWWGLCGQGTDERTALADLTGPALAAYDRFLDRHGLPGPPLPAVEVVERRHGDELTFDRDERPATDDELDRTVAVLRAARRAVLSLVGEASEAELDWEDPERELPAWAGWRTLRGMAWHLADTESRYYLVAVGVEPAARAANLDDELARSHEHVIGALADLPRDLVVEVGEERWSTRKVLRRLAWHERAELAVMERLHRRARIHLGS